MKILEINVTEDKKHFKVVNLNGDRVVLPFFIIK